MRVGERDKEIEKLGRRKRNSEIEERGEGRKIERGGEKWGEESVREKNEINSPLKPKM